MKISFSSTKLHKIDTLALAVGEDRQLGAIAEGINSEAGAVLQRTLESPRFTAKAGQVVVIPMPHSSPYTRIALYGTGKADELDMLQARRIGANLAQRLDTEGVTHASVLVETPEGCELGDDTFASEMAYGALLKSYRFDKYRTQLKDDQKPALTELTFHTEHHKKAQNHFTDYSALAEGIFLTRDIVSEPANVIHPESLAERCKELSKAGVDVEVLGEKQMEKLGMGALLGVGRGSVRESHLVIMRWNGAADKDETPIAVVGKGVTFDSGGICLKPAAGMEEMKWDMGGSAVVIGLMKALAGRKAKVNVVGVVGLVENMISGEAQRPGDVVTSMSGQTIEVINTDAEGRLVLADALWYTQDRFKPKVMINLATLTGAIIIALGKNRAGLFSNNDDLAAKLAAAGDSEGEKLWRFPIGDEYESHIKSDIADMKNVGKGREAGSISAAEFLSRFVNKVPWAHLDIAGTTWAGEDQDMARKGATAFGLRLLNRFIAKHYEA